MTPRTFLQSDACNHGYTPDPGSKRRRRSDAYNQGYTELFVDPSQGLIGEGLKIHP